MLPQVLSKAAILCALIAATAATPAFTERALLVSPFILPANSFDSKLTSSRRNDVAPKVAHPREAIITAMKSSVATALVARILILAAAHLHATHILTTVCLKFLILKVL